jgi:hypothetical protein
MANLSSPPQARQGRNALVEHEMLLKQFHENRKAFSLAFKMEDQRLGKTSRYSKTGTKDGDFSSKASNIVHLCPHCDQFKVIAAISQSEKSWGRIEVLHTASMLSHAPNCPTGPPKPCVKAMLQDAEFVRKIKLCKHNDTARDACREHFGMIPSDTTCSQLRKQATTLSAAEGYAEGFSLLLSYLQALAAANPGTTFNVKQDPITNIFESMTLILAQAGDFIRYAGRTYYCLDAGHTNCKGWYGKIFILVATDGEHKNVPIGIGIYSEESGDNYTDFLEIVKSHMGGWVGQMLNHPTTVICTDRHKSFCPAIRASLSRAHHRYDVRHIEENIKKNGALNRGPTSYIWACHRATTRAEYEGHLAAWSAVNEPAATYADAIIPHASWVSYTTVENTVHPHMLFSFTGSQSVEQEMSRFLQLKIRHQLPAYRGTSTCSRE